MAISAFYSIVVPPLYSVAVPSYLLINIAAPFIILISINVSREFLAELGWILLAYLVLFALSQWYIYLAHPVLNDKLILLNAEDKTVQFRHTFFTQSWYLFNGILLYLYLKYYATSRHLPYIFWSFRILVIYGFIEVLLYQLLHRNGDFLSNRMFDNVPGTGSLFQVNSIGGWVVQRMKSLTGEPSMFAFSVVPIWILSVGLKQRIDQVLFFAALVLSFSTSAYLGIFVLACGWLVFNRAFRKKYVWLLPLALLAPFALYYFSAGFRHFIHDAVLDKLTGASVSGEQRTGYMKNHISYWVHDLNFFGKLVGLGFGYARSTDFFSTLLVNNGIIGLLLFTWFFFKHALVPMRDRYLHQYYVVALIATYCIMMLSVPEFGYLSLWILLAFPYFYDRMSFTYQTRYR
ncbi:hypothetical protein DXN05_19135 [Deminuibacter soli]|uniref:O-antigen ligase domain-containing protein n=1 Tax=Deminuibacter soli TaxID=2291815 RepID=A0A3E1NFU5_9BACT|nr:hypothetical protein DXN05_19135 [Deminuibacter soli]